MSGLSATHTTVCDTSIHLISNLEDLHRSSQTVLLFSLELLMAYQEIRVRVDARPKRAFIRDKGVLVFNFMQFGLGNAEVTFPCVRDALFGGQIGKDVTAYLNDLLLYAFRFLQILPDKDLTVQWENDAKRAFNVSPLHAKYSRIGKLAKIREWPFTTTVHEMASFLI